MTSLHSIIGEFQEHYRLYLNDRLGKEILDDLTKKKVSIRGGSEQLEIADFAYIARNYKKYLEDDFGDKIHRLSTWFDELKDVRNKVAHYAELSREDKTIALTLIGRINDLAKLKRYSMPKPEVIQRTSTLKQMTDHELETAIKAIPLLTLEVKQAEFRVYREGQRGSIWIANQKCGYKIVTTGDTHFLDTYIVRLTGVPGKERSDRNHKEWRCLTLAAVGEVCKILASN